jgi:hypothetical protein
MKCMLSNGLSKCVTELRFVISIYLYLQNVACDIINAKKITIETPQKAVCLTSTFCINNVRK